MKEFFKHCYWAIRYGDWYAGWDREWMTKDWHGFFHAGIVYYDGYHAGVRVYKFYIGVSW